MNSNVSESFFAKLRQRLFRHFVDWEIFHRIFSHLQGRKSLPYPFTSVEEITEHIEANQLREMLDWIDKRSPEMGAGYAASFRYVMYRDLNDRLTQYARLAQRSLPPRARIAKLWAECA